MLERRACASRTVVALCADGRRTNNRKGVAGKASSARKTLRQQSHAKVGLVGANGASSGQTGALRTVVARGALKAQRHVARACLVGICATGTGCRGTRSETAVRSERTIDGLRNITDAVVANRTGEA